MLRGSVLATNSGQRKLYCRFLAGWLIFGLSGCGQAINRPINERLPEASRSQLSRPEQQNHRRRLTRPVPVIIQPPVPFRMAVLDWKTAQNNWKATPDIIAVAAEQILTEKPNAPRQLPTATHAVPAVAAAVRATFADYRKAFNRHDSVALAAHWTRDGENLDLDTGNRTTGQLSIEKDFDRQFTADQKSSVAYEIEAVRPVQDDVVVVDGISHLSFSDRAPARSRFSAVLVRHEDRWLIETIREAAALATPTIHDRLAELDWLRGSWEDVSDGVTASLQCDWNRSGTFLIRRHLVTHDPEPAGAAARLTAGVPALLPIDPDGHQKLIVPQRLSMTEYIGWDEARGEIHSWLFCSDGRMTELSWLRTNNGWLLTTDTSPELYPVPTQLTLTRIGSDEMTLRLSAGHAPEFMPVADFLRTARPFSSQLSP